MRLLQTGAKRCGLLVAALVLLSGWGFSARAGGPQDKSKEDPKTTRSDTKADKSDTKADKSDTPAKPADKRFKVEMRAKPWQSALDWLAEISGMPVILGPAKPTGTIDVVSPPGKEYTIAEIIDLFNDELSRQKFIIIRRARSFTVADADQKIDPVILPRIRPEELDQYGNTEMVSLILTLKTLVAEDIVGDVSKMMGPVGSCSAIASANQLVLQDTGGNLRRVMNTILDIEKNETSQTQSYQHQCKYIKCRQAEQLLNRLLGNPLDYVNLQQRMSRGDERSPFGPSGPFGPGGGPGSSRSSSRDLPITPKIRMHYVGVNEPDNTVWVTGPADKVALARTIVEKADVKTADGQAPVLIGPPKFQTYQVPGGNAQAIAQTLERIYEPNQNRRITVLNNNTLYVYASPEEHVEIARHISGGQAPPNPPKLIGLSTLDAATVAPKLTAMFGDVRTAPIIDVHPGGLNAVYVKGTPDQIAEVEAAVKVLENTGGGAAGVPTGMVRITLDPKGAGGTALAEALEKLLPQLIKNPIDVVKPKSSDQNPEPIDKPKAPPKQAPKDDGTKIGQQPGPRAGERNPLPPGTYVAHNDGQDTQDKGRFYDPRDEKKEDKPAANGDKPGAPITIMASGNRVLIFSDDRKALAQVQELVRLLTQSKGPTGDFQVIKLKHAQAAEAARVLDEVFNGPRPQGGGGGGRTPGGDLGGLGGGFGGGRFGGFGGGFAGGQAAAAVRQEPRIRVVADTGSNSLLVSASMLDMILVEKLLRESIDRGESDSLALLKTWVVGPLKFARAPDVATILERVYREQMGGSTSFSSGGFGGGPSSFTSSGRGGGGPSQSRDAGGNRRAVSLSVGVDTPTNTLILQCSEKMKQEIEKLIEELERAAKESTRVVRLPSIKGVDPYLVQQAIDALQGRPTSPLLASRSFGSGGMFGGGFGGGNFGGGNFGSSGFGGGFPGSGGAFPGGFNGSFPGGGRSTFFQGGGFPGGGGGFQGGGRGGFPGSGGGFQGGGGGSQGGGRGGGGRTASLSPDGGPDFFVYGVKDDPRPSNLLYDPQRDSSAAEESNDSGGPGHTAEPSRPSLLSRTLAYLEQLSWEELQPAAPAAPSDRQGPSGSSVKAELLTELGIVLVGGQQKDKAEVEATTRFLEQLQQILEQLRGAALEIQLVPLEYADATSVVNILSQLYTRVSPGTVTIGEIVVPAQLVMLPLPRFNAILLAAPRALVGEFIKEIRRLDQPTATTAQPTYFPLKKASATQVATLIQNFWQQRYPPETAQQNQIRVTADSNTNTVVVQAAPADLKEINDLIWRLDNTASLAVFDLRIKRLRNAYADELAALLIQALSQGIVPSTVGQQPGVTPGVPTVPGAPTVPGVQPGAVPGATVGQPTKTISLRFIGFGPKGLYEKEAEDLADVQITPDVRTNSLIVAAPKKTMDLLLSLIDELDTLPSARAEIKIFPLKRGNAADTAILLQQLFYGTGTTGALGGVRTGTQLGGGLGLGGLGLGGLGGQVRPLQFTLGGTTPEGAPLVELRLSIDERTNSIIAAGSTNDILIIEAIISRLEDSDVAIRRNDVYHLKNSTAADVATALTQFLSTSLQVLNIGAQLTAFQEIERQVVVVAEPISNRLLISASPRYYEDVYRLIQALDSEPPQVVIQVLLAEVQLDGRDEFGIEVGLQAPVLFQRGLLPIIPGDTATTGFTNVAGSPTYVPAGVTVNGSINPAAAPGFPFNTGPTPPLGVNPAVRPGIVGLQGLGNLGVGRFSPTSQVGGFVFSGASDTFSLLIRALKTQGRMEILSRPQIMTLDNQVATINIGQLVPYPTSSAITNFGVVPQFTFQQVGIGMQVTPKISPEGRVIMRVTPQISSISQQPQVNLGGGVSASIINQQVVDTTVSAMDGETVAIGGLIVKTDQRAENKIPWLGDLPGVGVLFRYRTQQSLKRELLVILTPRIVRNRFEAERVMAEESRRIDGLLIDQMIRLHGPQGMEAMMRSPKGGPGDCGPGVPPLPQMFQGAVPGPDYYPPSESLPVPRPLPPDTPPPPGLPYGPPPGPGIPPGPPPGPSAVPMSGPHYSPPAPGPQANPSGPVMPAAWPPADSRPPAPAEKGKESGRWHLLPRK